MDLRREAILGLLYFAVYMGYLFIHPENEFGHWVSLVGLPFLLLYLYQRGSLGDSALLASLASVGLGRGKLTSGLPWAMPVGLGLSGLQVFVSGEGGEIWQIIESGKVLYLFPLVLLLMLLTAGFTEEFFFRGVLQTRLSRLLRSDLLAVVLTSGLFGLYHLPYAYLNPRWPSHGDWGAAVTSAFTQGGLGGLILGWVYVRSGSNLLASVVVHSLVNALPGMTMVRFRGSSI